VEQSPGLGRIAAVRAGFSTQLFLATAAARRPPFAHRIRGWPRNDNRVCVTQPASAIRHGLTAGRAFVPAGPGCRLL
jgi:hypothetical protein